MAPGSSTGGRAEPDHRQGERHAGDRPATSGERHLEDRLAAEAAGETPRREEADLAAAAVDHSDAAAATRPTPATVAITATGQMPPPTDGRIARPRGATNGSWVRK